MKNKLSLTRRPLLALAGSLLVLGSHTAPAQYLFINADNSPYTINSSASYNQVYVGDSSNGTLNHNTYSLAVTQDLLIGVDQGISGTYNLGGTAALSALVELVGYGGYGTLYQSGGSNTLTSYLDLGYVANSFGTYTLTGTGTLSTPEEDVGSVGTGIFNQNGGTNTVGTNGLTLSGYTGTSSGTFNLNGGTLLTPSVSGSGADISTFNFNGGSLTATASNSNFMPHNLTTANVQSGGAKINSNGFDITIARGLIHDPTLGSSVDGGLTKSGGGTLTLTGANTYTGPTNVVGGALTVGTGGSIVGKSNISIGTSSAFNITGGNVTLSNNIIAYDGTVANPATGLLSAGSLSALSEQVGTYGGGTFTQTNGTNTIASELDLGYFASTNGKYTLSAGTLSAPNEYVGITGSGTFTQTGGMNTVSGSVYVGTNTGGSGGTYMLSGSGQLSPTYLDVGYSTTGTFNQTGGTVTASVLLVGAGTGGNCSYNLSGTSTLAATVEAVGDYSAGTFTQNGGSNTVNGTLSLGRSNSVSNGAYTLAAGSLSAINEFVGQTGSGTFVQNGGTNTVGSALTVGYYSSGNGTYSLNAGTLQTPSVTNGAGTGTFNFNGGTLQAAGNSPAFVNGLTTANVQAGGARIDSNGFDVTVSQVLSHDAALGATADGGLTKVGNGALILSGANTYTGNTGDYVGSILVTNTTGSATGTGAVDVGTGATFGGTGRIAGALTVESSGTLAPGTSTSPGKLTLGNTLSLTHGSSLAIRLGGLTAGTGYDQVAVGGLVTISGNINVSVVNGFTLATGQTFTILVNGSNSLTSGTFANATGLGLFYTDSRGDTFQINYAAATDGTVPNDVTLTVLTVANVPEPSTWAATFGGVCLLASARRFRRSRTTV